MMSGAEAEDSFTGVSDNSNWCYARRLGNAFLDFLDVADAFLDRKHDRCYCSECDDYPDVINQSVEDDGPTPYLIPKGWCRFGLAVPPRMQALNGFQEWSVSYHGVSSPLVLSSILQCGQLMKAGDKLLDGSTLKSIKCVGRQDPWFYTSPTIGYAGLMFYAEPKPFEWQGRWFEGSIVLQCRQRPGSYTTQGETMGFARDWPGHLEALCGALFDLNTIEWLSDENVGVIPCGLLVRVWKLGSDPERVNYSSPIDPPHLRQVLHSPTV